MATVHELRSRIKALSLAGQARGTREKLFYAAVIILVALLSFGLGRLSAFYGQGSSFQIQYTEQQ